MSCPDFRLKEGRVQFPFQRAWTADEGDAENTDRALVVVMQVQYT